MSKVKLLLLLALILSIALIIYSFLHYENDFQLIQLTSTKEDEFFCSWSPDSSKILYNFNFTLWMLDINLKTRIKLTDKNISGCGRFSQDGKKIVFEWSNELISELKRDKIHPELWKQNFSISVLDLENHKTKCLISRGFNYYPKWSPDGKKIAFLRIEESGRHLWVMDADGSNRIPLTHDMGNVECWDYDWSPDGSKIVFSTKISGEWSVWIMNADGSNKKKITNGLHPKWISENVIVYRTIDNELYRMTLDGKKERLAKNVGYYSINKYGDIVHDFRSNITLISRGKEIKLTKSGHEMIPVFSGDGKKIVFSSTKTGNFDIWLIVLERGFGLW